MSQSVIIKMIFPIVLIVFFPNYITSQYLTKSEFENDVNFTDCFSSTDGQSIYDFSIDNMDPKKPKIKLTEYYGKILLLMNVASFCGGAYDYPKINNLIDKYNGKLVVIAFPCDNFFNQEPLRNIEDMLNSMKYVRPGNGFEPKFNLTQKIDVNGNNTHPIFDYLKRSCLPTRYGYWERKYYNFDKFNSRDIKWNFEKFLIHPKTGQPIRRYDMRHNPDLITNDIDPLVNLAQ